jgi:hypothetical protein
VAAQQLLERRTVAREGYFDQLLVGQGIIVILLHEAFSVSLII